MQDGIASKPDHRIAKRVRPKTGSAARTGEEKNLALAVYAETLNQNEASRVSGVPKTTINGWLETEEGSAIVDRLRIAIRYEMAYKCVEVSKLALDSVLDRLKSGDWVINSKSGEQERIPVMAKDAAMIASMAIDKHALLTGTIESGKNINSGLLALAGELSKIGKAIKVPDTIEVIPSE